MGTIELLMKSDDTESLLFITHFTNINNLDRLF